MRVNYWHIQLHPDERLNIETIKSILTEKQVIGMGDSWNDKNGNPVNDPKWFRDDMKIGDVVMVPLMLYKGYGITSLQYAIFVVLAVQGLMAWKRSERQRAQTLQAQAA